MTITTENTAEHSKPSTTGRETLKLSGHLVTYDKPLFILNLFLWSMFHAVPALLAYAVSQVFGHLGDADQGKVPLNTAVAAAWIALGWFAFVRISRFGMFYGSLRSFIQIWYKLNAVLRRNLLDYLLNAKKSRQLGDTPAESVSRFRDDVDDVSAYIEVWIDGSGIVLYTLIAIFMMTQVDPMITLLVCAPLLLMVVFVQRLSPIIRKFRRRMRESTARVTDFIGETFNAVSAVKLAGKEQQMVSHLHELGETRRKFALRDVLLTELIRGVNTNMVNVAVGVVLLLGANKVRGETLGIEAFILFIGLLPRLSNSMAFFGDAIARHRRTGVSYDRMNRLLVDAEPDEPVQHRPVYLQGDPPPLEALTEDIEPLQELKVTDLTALHASGEGVKEASLSVQRGEFVVITGRIGSGKTTLLRALLGLIPRQSGEIYWNGQKLEDPATQLVPPRSAYTAQIPNLFSDSMQENILTGMEKTELKQAVRLAVLEPDLEQLPHYLETEVGARGVKLSGGQVQRTAVARMLAQKAELLVFDDVSSALDARTESQLWDGLFRETAATCLVVSHRRAALTRADRILIMQDGQITDEGTLNELLERNAEMRALWAEEQQEGE